MNALTSDDLRRDIGYLGTVLGDTIRDFEGEDALLLVEELRRAAWDRREGRSGAEDRIKSLVSNLDDRQMRIVIRAFSTFLDLLNLVEDRKRVLVLAERARDAYPDPRKESIRGAIAELKASNESAEAVQSMMDQLHVDLVFTAHPTEAKRRSVRGKLTKIRNLMSDFDGDPLPEFRQRVEREIRAEVAKLWQTDFIRPWRPSVMQEVGRGLSIKPVLWKEIPRIAAELQSALSEFYGDGVTTKKPCLSFGSWIGGDRDGHPGVTADVTAETFSWLRREALNFHAKACQDLFDSLSISARQVGVVESLKSALDDADQRWPETTLRLESIPPDEHFRRWLSVIAWRLEHSGSEVGVLEASTQAQDRPQVGYVSACELAGDVTILVNAAEVLPGHEFVAEDLVAWRTQIETFGLHLARLDIRQNAKVYSGVVNELLQHAGAHEDPASLDEQARCQALGETLGQPIVLPEEGVSPEVRETLDLFRVLHRVAAKYSMAAIGSHVISMTSAPSDVLTVLWLWELTRDSSTESSKQANLPIVPLLETIDDLANGPDILEGMLEIAAYREHLAKLGDHQMVMLGYSDSTKDGGYLSACWSLHEAQRNLVDVAKKRGISLSFFHGRGGSLGRGGGPAARSILSLPRGTFNGHLRLTEQGEVLANRYDDPSIAHRHLEQLIWSSVLALANSSESDSYGWYETFERLAKKSHQAYRELLEKPGFVAFFRQVTPISEIEQLPIGSRPSRRKPDGGLADLRAIPWVFSWTQSRCLIPAWFGMGTAMGDEVDQEDSLEALRDMYQNWPFFRALIDNAELALAKSDLAIAEEYANLASSEQALKSIGDTIAKEYRNSCRVVLALTGREELLDQTAWLKESIRVRNRFVDPINLIQVELLRRKEQLGEQQDEAELRHLLRLSINGIAAGMRTSG